MGAKNRLIEWIENQHRVEENSVVEAEAIMPPGIAREARNFSQQIPGYRVTPLKSLARLADMLGLGGLWVKDESQRLNLNSFKALGGAFVIYRFLKDELDFEEETSFSELRSDRVGGKTGQTVFAAATDGNHGRGVAWAASKLGYESVIYVHAKTSDARIKAIENYGARVEIIPGTYDDAVEQLSHDAAENGWQIISDTSWPGYDVIPAWIMQGYTTMYEEIQEQFARQGIHSPTHIFVQAGVGSLAASIAAYYRMLLGNNGPKIIVVEPTQAACLFESIKSGQLTSFEGELDTIMAGLACGEPNPMAWSVLKRYTDVFMSCPDYVAAKGMRVYAVPLQGDPFIVSGESGGVTLGAVKYIMESSGLQDLCDLLELDKESQVLLINTEGNTDPDYFRRVVWDGAQSDSE